MDSRRSPGRSDPPGSVAVPEHLRDQVAHELRCALNSGKLLPDRVYSAPTLAAEYGVSATPVREAMLQLARDGLVEPVRNRGFRITRITSQELAEFTQLRELIEIPLVGRVTPGTTAEQLDALRTTAEEALARAEAREVDGYLVADRRFHLDLLGLAGNRHAGEVVGDLHRRSRLHGLAGAGRHRTLLDAARDHFRLLDAMRAGDAAAAEEHMRRHLARARTG
ncbi:GntR family transcriptional regulator [Streptomyces oceani]|uniref:GntR family transcriptional regulator n=1 Tax=Streptomyces oceani TaxID=1075402 RepID=A0A1E7KIR8_9ACTN|nr:GntR family transcriptional regulator [Streptomyces oceani]OEV03858.1 GntR family transcriptional regulator [Streptomyces oceani]